MDSAPRKHPRWAASNALIDMTQAMGEDMLQLVATFTSCTDLCHLGCVSKRFSALPRDESMWALRALDILPVRQLYAAMSELHLTSFRQLVEVFTRIGIPGGVLGFWRADALSSGSWAAAQLELLSSTTQGPTAAATAANEAEACGELLRISLDSGGFLCESIAPNGTSRGIFAIRLSRSVDQKVKVGFFSLEDEPATRLGGSGWVPGRSIGEAFLETATAISSAAERTPIRPSGRNAFYLRRDGGRKSRFTKMTPPAEAPLKATPVRSTMPAAAAQDLCGLWCAPYGNHGLEIIQLSVDPASAGPPATVGSQGREAAAAAKDKEKASRSSTRDKAYSWMSHSTRNGSSNCSTCSDSACTSAPASDNSSEDGFGGSCSSMESDEGDHAAAAAAATAIRKRLSSGAGEESGVAAERLDEANLPPQLFGLKVTGDANVPAGKTSFAIDLETECSVDAELKADARPVILFLPSGAVMANLSNRREQISFWRRGRGQINRVPGRWSPEWVDVDFVVYQAGARCAFSVVFRQPTQAVRVIMDFERALGSKEDWPRWSTSLPLTA